jgi:hypothetical protein
MLNKLICGLIIFLFLSISVSSQDISDEQAEAHKFIDDFFWYRKYLPIDSISELYTLRNTFVFLKENDPDGFEKSSVSLNENIHGLNNKVLEKIMQRLILTDQKMDVIIREYESNTEVQELNKQYIAFKSIITESDYPDNDICLDKIEEFYSRFITGLGYKTKNSGDIGVINSERLHKGTADYNEDNNNNSERAYTVIAGDYLRKIAASFYGNERYWQIIYGFNGNHNLFGDNPDLIYPGITIEIPPLPER